MRLTLTITMTAFATLFGFPASPHAVTPGTNTVEAAIRADWTRQETALNCVAGSPESIRAAIARGRALAEDMKKIGKTQAAELCLKRLADAETEISRTVTPEVTAKDGRHLIRAVICGAGAPLDSGRVRGRDYALTEPTVWKETGQTTLLTSLSWDQTEVIYRFAGLNPAARYRLRAVYGAHGARTLRLAVGGQVLHDVQMPDDVAFYISIEIPA